MKHRPTIHIKLRSQLIQFLELIHQGRLTNCLAVKQDNCDVEMKENNYSKNRQDKPGVAHEEHVTSRVGG